MKVMTEKREKVLRFISSYVQEEECFPTYREMMEGLGYNALRSIGNHLDRLEREGFIERRSGRTARNVRITAKGKAFLNGTTQSVSEGNQGQIPDV